jgi:glyoxylase-like metal-dependent hydrolase (beta-lactamase superfamily II)
MEIVKGVYRLTVPLPQVSLKEVNIYVLEGEKGNILIDTGWNTPEAFDAVKKGLKENGFELRDITQILITHFHPDHYGMAGKLKQLSGATIGMSEVEASMLDGRYENPDALLNQLSAFLRTNGLDEGMLEQYSRASMTFRHLVILTRPDVLLKDGDVISMPPFELKVLQTPGHSPGHLCFYEPKRKMLFTGDMLLPEISTNISYNPQSGENPLGDFMNSLNRLKEMEVNFVFPSHGPVFSGTRPRVENLLYHHKTRIEEIISVARDNLMTAYQIAAKMTWYPDSKPLKYDELQLWDKRLALMETLAHLQYLVHEGRAKKMEENGLINYFVEG